MTEGLTQGGPRRPVSWELSNACPDSQPGGSV